MKTPQSPSLAGSTINPDARSIESLRSSAARDPKGAIKETAKQFEALFTQQLMKSMRDATLSSGLLENAGSQMGTEMLDAQFAKQMAGLPGGLADILARQLECQTGVEPDAAAAASSRSENTAGVDAGRAGNGGNGGNGFAAAGKPTLSSAAAAPQPASAARAHGVSGNRTAPPAQQRQAEFLRAHQQAAQQAEAESGIPAAFMVAQAAHESGWGAREIRNADGTASNNLFGIKAGPGWTGPVTKVTTTEYIRGEAQKVVAKFRAYASPAEAFKDYAKLLTESPRYSNVVAKATTAAAPSPQRFAQGLQRAGYATDPAYADKLTRIINTTLRLQRVVT